MATVVKKGQTWYCPVCGAEVTVIRVGRACPELVCCQRPMIAKPELVVFYVCEICGAEVVMLRGQTRHLNPHCCNQPMNLQTVA